MGKYEPLTTSRIANTQAGTRDIWLADSDGSRGFGRLVLRISPRGARHFYFKVNWKGVRRVIPLGPYSKDSRPNHLTLNQARAAARQVLSALRSPQADTAIQPPPSDPGARLREAPTQATRDDSAPAQRANVRTSSDSTPPIEGTLEELCEQYVEHLNTLGKVSSTETGKMLGRHLKGTPLACKAAATVTSQEIAAHLRSMASAQKARTAGLLRAAISAALQ